MIELTVFVGLVGLVAATGVWLGMLVAPRLGRLVEPPDEGPGADGNNREGAGDDADR